MNRARYSTSFAKRHVEGQPTITALPTKRSTGKWVLLAVPFRGSSGNSAAFEGNRFFHADGKARFQVTEYRESGHPVDHEFPIYLTTGRVVSQYLSGTQTRRIGALVDQYPEPRVEIHPRLAKEHGIEDEDWVTVTTRRSDVTLCAMVVRTIRPDTVFIPYHWGGRRSANLLTHRTIDPRSKIPEYKVSACNIRKSQPPPSLE